MTHGLEVIDRALNDGLVLIVKKIECGNSVVATLENEQGETIVSDQSPYVTRAIGSLIPKYTDKMDGPPESIWWTCGGDVGQLPLDKWFNGTGYLHAASKPGRIPVVQAELRLYDDSPIVSAQGGTFAEAYDRLTSVTFGERFYEEMTRANEASRDLMHNEGS